MENLAIFLLSIFINLSEFDKYRLNSYFSENNHSFFQYIDNKNLFFSSFNYKIENDKNYIERITLPINSFKKIKEIRFLTYEYFKARDVENLDVICSFTTCDFIFSELKVKNLNIELISELTFKNDFTFILKKKPEILKKKHEKKINLHYKPDFKINNLEDNVLSNVGIERFNLNDFISEIKLKKNFDLTYLALLEQKITNYETNKIEVNKFLAEYINKKEYRTAYIAYTNSKFFLISKTYYDITTFKNINSTSSPTVVGDFNNRNARTKLISKQNFFLIKEHYQRNGNFNFNFPIFNNFKPIQNYFKEIIYIFNNFKPTQNYFKEIIYIIMLIFSLKILFIKISENRFIKFKFYFIIFYFIIIDSIILNLYSIFFIFYFFLLNKKHLKHV